MTPSRLSELRALCDAATPGPWFQWRGHLEVKAGPPKVNQPGVCSGYRGEICEVDDMDFPGAKAKANAAFIAAARQALPDALEEIERLTNGEIACNTWGLSLIDGLGEFLKVTAEADGPRSTKINCHFEGEDPVPVIHLWATTDDQSPVARNEVLSAEIERMRKALEAIRDMSSDSVNRRPIWSYANAALETRP